MVTLYVVRYRDKGNAWCVQEWTDTAADAKSIRWELLKELHLGASNVHIKRVEIDPTAAGIAKALNGISRYGQFSPF
jgi:hypothetical protein